MNKRKLERVAVLILSIAMLLSSTGIMSSLAANVSESSAVPSSSSSQTETSTSVTQEGGEVTTSKVTEEGGSLVADENGNGTAENPYKISTASDLLKMSDKINLTTSSNKYFVLTSDIDLSGVTESDFAKNGGSLVTVNKSLAKSSENVFFNLNGNGHVIKGLDINAKSSAIISIFGFVNQKSSIKNLKIEKPHIKSTSDSLVSVSVLVSENSGTIKNVEVIYPVLSVIKSTYAGFVAAVNNGTISNVTVKGTHTSAGAATADNHTITASGSVGAVAGINRGTITGVSAINIGMFVPTAEDSKTVYGGIAGRNEGTISDCVSTGNVFGGKSSDIAGGVAGKAGTGCKLVNNYTFVTLTSQVSGCGVIGSAGTADMINDCYWSSTVSGRAVPVTNACGGVDDVSTNGFKVVRIGETAKITEADVKNSVWGKAVFALDGQFKTKGDGLTLNADSTAVEIKGINADSIGTVTYLADVTLPATVGAGSGSVTVKQYMRIYVFTVPQGVNGMGTESDPLVITNSAEFNFLHYAQGISVKLGKDITVSKPVALFAGSFNGDGHTVNTKTQMFSAVTGKVKNLNVLVTEDITTAVFGTLYGAQMNDVAVSCKDGTKLSAVKGNTGIFANRIADKSVIDSCAVKGTVAVDSENLNNIGGFAGVVNGNGTKITNSGAAVSISEKDGKRTTATANFIGLVSGENTEISNCYAAGSNTAGKYMFIGAIDAKSVALGTNYIEKCAEKGAAKSAVDFAKYTSFVNEKQFAEWKFDSDVGFFTGVGGTFASTLPSIKTIQNSKAEDFRLVYDASKVAASVSVNNSKLVLNVNRANGVVTVKALPVKVINTKTGLSATIYVSNGLEKDSSGNWIVSTAYDLAYIGENIEELSKGSFVLNADVDMSVIGSYTPIGSSATAFSGKFDGNGHTITGISINGSAKTALFGTLSDAEVRNIRITKATVNSEGGYAAVLAGQATGKTVISDITVENSKVTVNDNFAAVIVASVDNAAGVKISNVTVKSSTVKSNANYVGAIAGRLTDNASVSAINIDGFKASGSNYVAGAVGLANGAAAITMSSIKVASSDISGVSDVSGIAAGIGSGADIKNAEVKDSAIYTIGADSAFTAGGISAVYGSSMENVAVENTKISAGIAGGVVGKTASDCSLVIKNAVVDSVKVSSTGANTVAAGILGVHNVKGTAQIKGGKISDDVVISGASVTAGIVGDCTGAESVLKISGTKTFAQVNGGEANAVASAGVIGRVGASAINSISIDGVKVGGSVTGSALAGGIIGLIKNGEAYNGKSAVISNTVAYPQLISSSQCGMIIGDVETKKVLESKDLDKAVVNTVISTYYGSVSAYSADSGLAGGGYIDMDKPNGSAITSSVPVITTAGETNIKINNLPAVKGYTFDKNTGWVSESDERIQVVSCTENTAVLKANHMADISVVGYYVSDADSDVKVPVHFRAVSDIRTPLKGSGTKADPYRVSNAYDLETVAQYNSENSYFVLTNDITFVPADFEFGGAFYNVGNGVVTIGSAESGFKGNFDGKGHSINGLAVSGNAFGGLFGAVDGAVISNIVINGADISGLNYAAVVAGSAKNTVIKNITINSAKVRAVEFGGYAGSVVGYAENTTIENITVDGAQISAGLNATVATVEYAGGVAGVFGGAIKSIKVNGTAVKSGTFAGGVVASASSVNIENADITADVSGQIAGGIIGEANDPMKLSVSNAFVGGTVSGAKTSAGIIGKVNADSSVGLEKLTAPMISNAVVTAVVEKSEICGAAIGDASAKVFTNAENSNTNVFDKIYYSSYQNTMGVFGNEEINSYQNSEYTANDLSNIKYVVGNIERDSIPLSTEFITLGDNALKLEGLDGSFKTFTLGGKSFALETIRSDKADNIVYDSAKSSVKLSSALVENEKAVLVYNNGLETAIDAAQASALLGSGTQSNPYQVSNTDDFAIMLQNSANEDVYYRLTSDIKLKGIGSAEQFAGNLDGDGHVLYDYTGTGLFGRATGSISNVGFAGFVVENNTAAAVGAVAGVVDGGKIENCFVIADVTANGTNQDVGILAGRAVDGAVINGVVTSGKVDGLKSLASGGVVGSAINAKISDVTSTGYIKGGKTSGGIVGDAQNSVIANAVFGNMLETNGKSGNIVGTTVNTDVKNAYYDSQCTRASSEIGMEKTTAELTAMSLNGFKSVGGYPVPAKLADLKNAKFAVGVAFASMKVNYLAGLNAGTVYNYTGISVEPQVLGNDVKLDTKSGLSLTLVPTADYVEAENAIVRYSNPAASSGINVICNFVDATNGLMGDKLAGILLKTKIGEQADAFNYFTKASDDAKQIGSVVVTDGVIYADAVLPDGVKYTVNAVDEKGKDLSVSDAENEGSLISTGSAKTVVITITAENDTESNWGLHSVWGVIGK